MIYRLFLYKYQVQNTLPPQRRGGSMTQVPPLADIGSVALWCVNRNIVVSVAEEKKRKEKRAFSAALDAWSGVKCSGPARPCRPAGVTLNIHYTRIAAQLNPPPLLSMGRKQFAAQSMLGLLRF